MRRIQPHRSGAARGGRARLWIPLAIFACIPTSSEALRYHPSRYTPQKFRQPFVWSRNYFDVGYVPGSDYASLYTKSRFSLNKSYVPWPVAHRYTPGARYVTGYNKNFASHGFLGPNYDLGYPYRFPTYPARTFTSFLDQRWGRTSPGWRSYTWPGRHAYPAYSGYPRALAPAFGYPGAVRPIRYFTGMPYRAPAFRYRAAYFPYRYQPYYGYRYRRFAPYGTFFPYGYGNFYLTPTGARTFGYPYWGYGAYRFWNAPFGWGPYLGGFYPWGLWGYPFWGDVDIYQGPLTGGDLRDFRERYVSYGHTFRLDAEIREEFRLDEEGYVGMPTEFPPEVGRRMYDMRRFEIEDRPPVQTHDYDADRIELQRPFQEVFRPAGVRSYRWSPDTRGDWEILMLYKIQQGLIPAPPGLIVPGMDEENDYLLLTGARATTTEASMRETSAMARARIQPARGIEVMVESPDGSLGVCPPEGIIGQPTDK